MSDIRKPLPEYTHGYTAEILTLARDHIQTIAPLGEHDVVPFQYGQEHGTMFLSRDANLLIGAQKIMIDAVAYYIGVNQKMKAP